MSIEKLCDILGICVLFAFASPFILIGLSILGKWVFG